MLPILHQSYWRDEAFSVLLASKNLKEILLLTIKDVHPPLYYFLLHFWIKLFGDFEYVTRSLSLLFFLLLVLSSFFLIKHFLKDWKISLLGSLAILLNPFLIEYAFEARAYIFLAFLIVTSTLFYLKKKHLLFTLFLALSLLTHNFAIFFLGSFIAFWFYENRENLIKKMGQFVLLFSFPILIFIVWMNFLWNQWVKVTEGFWIGQKTSAVIVETFRAYFQGVGSYPSAAMFYNLSIILVFFGLAYWIVRIVNKEALVSRFARNKEKDSLNKDNFLLIFLFSIPFLITYLISAFWTPIFHERFLMPILPLFIVWIIYSLFKLFDLNRALSYLIFALSLAYIFLGIQGAEEIMRKNTKPTINYAVKQVLAISGDEDIIVPESNLNFLEIKYYIKRYGRNNPVYAFSQEGKIPFYIGAVLFGENEIIKEYPKDRQIWIITPDGGYHLKKE